MVMNIWKHIPPCHFFPGRNIPSCIGHYSVWWEQLYSCWIPFHQTVSVWNRRYVLLPQIISTHSCHVSNAILGYGVSQSFSYDVYHVRGLILFKRFTQPRLVGEPHSSVRVITPAPAVHRLFSLAASPLWLCKALGWPSITAPWMQLPHLRIMFSPSSPLTLVVV